MAWKNLFAAFDAALRLLHPFMPFLTEELWHQLPQKAGAKSIALDAYPEAAARWKDAAAVAEFALIQEVIQGLRTVRSEMKLDPKKKVPAEFASAEAQMRGVIAANLETIQRLGNLAELRVLQGKLPEGGGGMRSTAEFDLRIPYVEETVDVAAELARLKKEIEGLERAIASKEKQLGNETFRSRAPEKVVREMEEVLAGQRVELGKMVERRKALGGA